jgi:hypothetical protein
MARRLPRPRRTHLGSQVSLSHLVSSSKLSIESSAQIALANRLNAETNRLPTSSASSSSKDGSASDSPRPEVKPEPTSAIVTLPALPGTRPPTDLARARVTPPFILANDAVRAVMHAVQTLLGFAFMLILM